MTQVLRVGEHLRRVMDSDDCSHDWRVQFYVYPTPTRDVLRGRCFLKKRIIGMEEESQVQEQISEAFK